MFRYIQIIFLSFVICFCSFAQKVTIKGIAPGAEGKTISLITYSDQITYLEKKIASAKVDSNGRFQIAVTTYQTIFTFLTIEYHKAELYIEPNANYEVKIQRVNYDSVYDVVNPFLEPQTLNMEIVNSNNKELNFLIRNFNVSFNNFIVPLADSLYLHPVKKKVESFINKTTEEFSDIKNEYFKNYVRYKLAAILQMAQIKGDEDMIRIYFLNQPVLYENVEYMDLFNNLFTNYIISGSKKIKYNDIENTINVRCNYLALLDSLGKDTILRNEVFREMVLLKNMLDLLNSKEFYRENIIKMLQTMIQKTKFEQHKIIAKNIITSALKLYPSTKAPDFNLPDLNGQMISLAEFKGKYIYLFFWKSACIPCIQELQLINGYKQKYGDRIEFIGISVDRKKDAFLDFIRGKNFKWNVLYANDDKELLESYNAKVLPLFILIDENGEILNYPAMMPSENVERLFKIFVQLPPNKKIR